jgi:TonB-dependent starch-binding outer membrane protein SusC
MKKVYRSCKTLASVFLLLLLACITAFAQQKVVTGTIRDPQGIGMPGVNVLKKGTTVGTSTDAEGKFSLEVSEADVLVLSFIGYESQEIKVGAQTNFDVTLVEDVATLSEVVVVGYGTQKKSDLTGAVSSLSGESLRGSVTTSFDQALQGRMAGVQVTQNTGQPGGVVSIRVRGTTSLTGSSEPLYVIDGLQVSGSGSGIAGFDWQGGAGGQQQAASNPLASLNPADIESIEVLKDASATAIYGSRAANGVVMITTKRGKKGAPRINYDGYYAVQEVYKTFDMMDLREYAAYNNQVSQEVSTISPNPRFADPSLLGPGTDWQDAIFQIAPMQSHTVTASGATDQSTYMISGGYFKQEGIIIGSKFDRFTIRTNLETRVREGFRIGTNISLSRKTEKITLNDGGDGVISQAAQMGPHIPVRDFNGEFAGPDQQNVSPQVSSNPVALALLRNNTVANNRFMANFYGDVDIIKGLTFRSEISTDVGNTANKAFIPTYQWGKLVNAVSQLGQRADMSFFWLWKNYATYNKSFGSHDLTVMAGTEAQKSQYEGFTAFKSNLPNDIPVLNQGEISNIANTGYKGWNSLYSLYARANYSYADKYLLTATIRRDGSSKFGPQNRFGVFPSVSFAWKISNESFLASQSELLSGLKLRVGWGKVGNQEISNYAFGSSLNSLNSYFGSATINSSYSNPKVQWESTAMTNLGIDAEFFSGRLTLSVDAYSKITDNLLLRVNLPSTFGDMVQGPQANVGSMENKGIELALTSVNVDMDKFRWSTTANLSVNRNEVTDIGGSPIFNNLYWYSGFQNATVTNSGYAVGQFYGYVMEGIFKTKEEILGHAVQIPSDEDPDINKIEKTTGLWLGDIKWKDLNKDGKITSADQTVIGDPNPDFTFGFNNSFSYGPFSLDVFMIGSIGGDILNFSRARNEQMLGIFDNQSVTVNNRARTQLIEGGTNLNDIDDVELVNPETTMPRFDNGGENSNHYMSTRWIEDGSYVRIQNIKLGYTLPTSIVKKVKLSRMHVYANIQNVATFTDYSGLDPQIGAFNQSSLRQNIDMGRYPSPRVYTFGVNVDF